MGRESSDGVSDDDDDRRTEVSSSALPRTSGRLRRPKAPRDAAEYYDEIEDFKAVLRAIEHEATEDLSAPIAARGHLERLMEEYWGIRVVQQLQQQQQQGGEGSASGKQRSANKDDTATAAATRAEILRLRILRHPNAGVTPQLMRWPLDNLAVPRPRWSLADELTTVLDRARRQSKPMDQVKDEDEDDDEDLDELPPSLCLPAITQCQAALMRLLHDVAHRDIAAGGQSKYPRRDIITWRDVLKVAALQRHTPPAVLAATQARLNSIYGCSQDGASSSSSSYLRRFSEDPPIPPPAMLAGFAASARDALTAHLLAPNDPVPAAKSEHHIDVTKRYARKRHLDARRAQDEELLFDGRPTFVPSKPQRLASPPIEDDDNEDMDIAPAEPPVKRAK